MERRKKANLALSIGLSAVLHFLVLLLSGTKFDTVSNLLIFAVGGRFLLAIGVVGPHTI